MNFNPWLACAFVLFCFAPGSVVATDESFDKTIAPFLKEQCHRCHGAKKQEGGIRLDNIEGVQLGNRNLWTMVHGKIASGEMPPKASPQPTDAEKKQVLTWIGDRQRSLGVGASRRLNRRELSAALRDVTGLAVDFSLALPGDGTVAGFDTGDDGLQEASDAVALWLQVTRRAVDGIRFLDPPNGKGFSADLRESKDARKAIDAWKADGASGRRRRGLPPRRQTRDHQSEHTPSPSCPNLCHDLCLHLYLLRS